MNHFSIMRTPILLLMLFLSFANMQCSTISIKQDLSHNQILDCAKQIIIDKPITAYTIPTILIGTASTGGTIITGGVGPILIGSGIAIGAWLIELLSRKNKHKQTDKQPENKKNNDGGGVGPDKDPDDDPDKDKTLPLFPFGKYKENQKHHQNSTGKISKPPKNGQKVLDESIPAPNKDYRVGIEDGKFVKFMKDGIDSYHSFIIEKFQDLDQFSKNALYNAGLIKDPIKGKIK